ncbi:MAG: hypothetical protein AAF892_03625 [Cyanobacteria bacterium P01_D01_bin.71]
MSDFANWAKELATFFEAATQQTEAWAEQTLQDAVDTADAIAAEIEKQIAPTLEEWADHLNQSLEPLETALDQELERFSEEFTEFVNPVVVPLTSALENWVEALAAPVTSHIDPMLNEHVPCIGCQHYHGQIYSGNMFVCAMYPYGPEQEKCPDWKS